MMKDTDDTLMAILDTLSSRTGDETQQSNRSTAERCLEDPSLLAAMAEALSGKEAALLGDCAEVMTIVASQKPGLVAPYITCIVPLLSSRTTKVRWEAMHAFSLVAHLVPEAAGAVLEQLQAMIQTDKSTIVRDYATDALGNLARADRESASAVYPLLQEALLAADGKHAGRALAGLLHVVTMVPELADEVRIIAEAYAGHSKPVVRRAVKALVKTCDLNRR